MVWAGLGNDITKDLVSTVKKFQNDPGGKEKLLKDFKRIVLQLNLHFGRSRWPQCGEQTGGASVEIWASVPEIYREKMAA